MTLTEIRQQYPQYDHVDDDTLKKALHKKHYSHVPYEKFDKAVSDPAEAVQEPQEEQSFLSAAGETVRTIGQGAAAEIAAGYTGLASALTDGVDQGLRVAEETRQDLAYTPEGERSQEQLEMLSQGVDYAARKFKEPFSRAIGTAEAVRQLDPVAGVEAYQASQEDMGQALGDIALDVTGSPEYATAMHLAPTLAEAALGGKGVKMMPQRKSKRQLRDTILNKEVDPETVGWDVKDGKLVKNKKEIEAVNQGFDPRRLAPIKHSSKQEKSYMRKMVGEMKRIIKDPTYDGRITNPIGESIQKRIQKLNQVNDDAGKVISKEAKTTLLNDTVDIESHTDNFITRLEDDLRIKFDDDLTPDFTDSSIKNLEANKKIITDVIERLQEIYENPNAQKVHDLKKMIDNDINWGGADATGVKGEAKAILKQLRGEISDALNSKFEKYGEANKKYSETIELLAKLQKKAGRDMDLLSEKAAKEKLGNLSQKLLTNYGSVADLRDLLAETEKVATRYGGKYSDNLNSLVSFAEELEARFPLTRPDRSFESGLSKVAKEGAEAVASDRVSWVARKGAKAMEKLTNKSDENAIKAIEALLSEAK